MRDPEAFTELYQSSRERLLALAYAWTGDLRAARGGVRQAFVLAAHHWPKVSQLTDAESWIRRLALDHAERRHAVRPWHRERSLDPDLLDWFDALGKLPKTHRRVLVLTLLSGASDAAIAEEVGLSHDDAVTALDKAIADMSGRLGVDTDALAASVTPILDTVRGVRFSKPDSVCRAGDMRRRSFTTLGSAAALVGFAVAGTLATGPGGAAPYLTPGSQERREQAATIARIPQTQLLSDEDVLALDPKADWQAKPISTNTGAKERPHLCQIERFADPRSLSSLSREVVGSRGSRELRVIQQVENSVDDAAADRTYETAKAWFVDCATDRSQLMETYSLSGAGDEADLFVLTMWEQQVTLVGAVVRTGRLTSTVWLESPLNDPLSVEQASAVVGSAVTALCEHPQAGSCAAAPVASARAPYDVGPVVGMIGEVDLPAVTGVPAAWVGTDPVEARTNLAASGCVRGSFMKEDMTNNVTRTFLMPDADVPDTFGLTQSVATLTPRRAKDYLTSLRDRIDQCVASNLGTTIVEHVEEADGREELYVVTVTTELDIDRSITYDMALLRSGPHISQIGFFGAATEGLSDAEFEWLARRALVRLDRLG